MKPFVKQGLTRLLSILLLTVILCAVYLSHTKNDKLSVYILDIGQGDSILIKSPDNKYLLVDGGPNDNILSSLGSALPFWVRKINYVILTHPDLDHVGGLPAVLERYEVENIIYTPIKANSSQYVQFRDLIQKKDIKFEIADSTDDFKLGCCVFIDILWPEIEVANNEEIKDPNDISVSFRLRYENFDAFFGGDLSYEKEQELCRKNPMDLDLLKIGHHGSSTSTSSRFLECARPELAVISVGEGNKYNHPDSEVIERLNDMNINYKTTAEWGTIHLQTDGESLWW
ncbi:MBL fold metallo-hydrolase [Candidatus Dojkabacteria bacterium]|nr:MBL fold metallo-hydrolase [Candidatus Dojkabacteria bacterium]